MLSRRSLLQSSAAAAAYLAVGSLDRAGRQRARRHRYRDQDRPDHALQRAGLGLWRDRQDRSRLFQDDQRDGRRSTAASSISSASTMATARPRRSSKPAVSSKQEQVAFIFGSLGTPTNAAIRSYLNDNKVPQLFIATRRQHVWRSAALSLDDGLRSRTIGPRRASSPNTFSRRSPTRKSACSIKNDAFGKDYLTGLRDGLGADHAGDDRQGSLLRGLRADRRLAGRHAAGRRAPTR